jgi:hypothetical protein
MRGYVRYAIRRDGAILLRALPTRRAAESLLAAYPGAKVIVDPRSIGR